MNKGEDNSEDNGENINIDENNELTDWQQQMIEELGGLIDVLRAYKKFGINFPLFTDNYFEALRRLAWLGMNLMPHAINEYNLSIQLPEIYPIFEEGVYWAKINPK